MGALNKKISLQVPAVQSPLLREAQVKSIDFSLVIAAYKDAPHIVANSLILARYFAASQLQVEFIFVEDASPDDTLAKVYRAAQAVCIYGIQTHVIEHPHNRGRGAAVRTGIESAVGTCVGFIDIDLEHKHQPLLAAIEKISTETVDVVVGQRYSTNPMAKPLRWVLSYGYRCLLRLVMPLPVRDTEAGFKLFRREKILPVLALTENPGWFWDTEVVHRSVQSGLRVEGIPIEFTQNINKESTVSAVKDSFVYFKTLLAYLWKIKHESK